jgi:hypothetical protein
MPCDSYGTETLSATSDGAKARKSFHVECVDAVASRLLRAAQMDSVMNPASGPTVGGAVANDFLVFLRGEGHQFHVRNNHLLDDLPRFTWVKWRLEGGSGQHRISLSQAMGADKPAMLPPDQFFKYGESRQRCAGAASPPPARAPKCQNTSSQTPCFVHPFFAIFINRLQDVIACGNLSGVNAKAPFFD